ncbi:MAG: DUF4296 domain-containing protein [Bacteroidetes bacterium]|nr:MAG: DUF4296 domain-containing protein [Bacteroidota bacterium]
MKKTASLTSIIIILALTFNACNWFSSENRCEKHLDRRTMANVLTDVFLLESQISNQPGVAGIRDSVANYYAGIFNKHGITRVEFEKAFECYLLDQDNMAWVMDEVLSAISIQQSKLDEKREESE